MSNRVIIVFLRVPQKGRVKTRLSKTLDHDFVLKLYKGFVLDLLDELENCGTIKLYFYPWDKGYKLEKWLGDKYPCFAQTGDNIGQRMASAFIETFKSGSVNTVLVGTDIPEFNKNIIFNAFKALKTYGAVIGPSTDGGYYLIGFQKTAFSKNIFNHINWSTRFVLDQTLKAFKRNSIGYKLVSTLDDIDTMDDLNGLIYRLKKGGKTGKRTRRALKFI